MQTDERIWKQLLDIQKRGRFVFYFVGGCVRDLCFGIHSRDIDIVFEGDACELFNLLSPELNKSNLQKSNLSTLSIHGDSFEFDFASPRSDDYPKQNGMPIIVEATVEEDLSRRDFTVNTGYLEFSDESIGWFKGESPDVEQIMGKIRYAHPMFETDIKNRQLRILHKNSFKDDPSRLLRAIKFKTLLNLAMEQETEVVFRKALSDRRIEQLDTARYLRIMWDYIHHDHARILMIQLDEKGLLPGEESYLDLHKKAERLQSRWVNNEFDLNVVLYVIIFFGHKEEMKTLSYLLNRIVKEIETILDAIEKLSSGPDKKKRYLTYTTLYNKRVESIACANLILGDSVWINLFMTELSRVKVYLTGADLMGMGIEEGPQIGKLKEELLIYKLNENPDMDIDGEIRWIESAKNETGS